MSNPFAGVNAPFRMRVGEFDVGLHMPRALPSTVGRDGEIAQALPPYAPRPVFSVDDYPACPEEWVRGGADSASWFVPIKVGHGMWLDLTANQPRYYDHDIAAVVSVQGVNAITALPVGSTRLEQHRHTCPVHNIAFHSDRFCPTCKFKWPAQNYLATTTGRPFWIDGWRTSGANGQPTGDVRQFYFTEEEGLGVAAQIIGERRVFAIGVAFYLSKNPKPQPVHVGRKFALESYGAESASKGMYSATRSMSFGAKPIEIGAGAKIRQDLGVDPNDLDYWADKPAGTLLIYYTDEATAAAIIQAGKTDRDAGGEGALAGLRTGFPGNTAQKFN